MKHLKITPIDFVYALALWIAFFFVGAALLQLAN